MIEIPESFTLSRQGAELLVGKTVEEVIPPTSPHKFTWYNGDPESYSAMLAGKTVTDVHGYGSFVEIDLGDDAHILVGDGTNIRYFESEKDAPIKHQLALVMKDGSALVFTVAMYGGIYAYTGTFDNPYYQGARTKISPLDIRFDEAYFQGIVKGMKKDISVKALLGTEQRIPGVGNGVLQDILFEAGIHPKRKISTLNDSQWGTLFLALKDTLAAMAAGGGRDTEKDMLGNWGGYKSLLSKNTYKSPCPRCGGEIVKEAYLGGTVYYCPVCQPMKEK